MAKKVLIVGTGLAGLATALRLARRGYEVELVEKNDKAGGRLNQLKKDGFTFDVGPSFFSMSYEFDEFVKDAGIEMPFKFVELDPLYSVNFLSTGKTYNIYKDLAKLAEEFKDVEPNLEEKIKKYLGTGQKLFDGTVDLVVRRNYNSLMHYFFTLMKAPPSLMPVLFRSFWQQVSKYFTSEEVKETAFRIDGLLKSNRESRPLYFTEVQFQPKDDFYSKFFAEIFVYLHRNQSNQDWRGVALFARKSLEPQTQKRYKELLNNKRVRRIYLDQLSISENSSLGLKAIGLIVQGQNSAQKTVELTRELISEAKEELEDDVLAEAVVELMKTIVVYKLPNLSRQELEAMFELADLKETRYVKELQAESKEKGKAEGKAEGKIEGKLESVPGFLALGLTVEQIASVFGLDVEVVKKAAENSAVNPPTEENTNN